MMVVLSKTLVKSSKLRWEDLPYVRGSVWQSSIEEALMLRPGDLIDNKENIKRNLTACENGDMFLLDPSVYGSALGPALRFVPHKDPHPNDSRKGEWVSNGTPGSSGGAMMSSLLHRAKLLKPSFMPRRTAAVVPAPAINSSQALNPGTARLALTVQYDNALNEKVVNSTVSITGAVKATKKTNRVGEADFAALPLLSTK